jgi:hypothetical protein
LYSTIFFDLTTIIYKIFPEEKTQNKKHRTKTRRFNPSSPLYGAWVAVINTLRLLAIKYIYFIKYQLFSAQVKKQRVSVAREL